MDKETSMKNLAREAYEKGSFNGTWLYAENGRIVSKGAYGFRDAENKLPMQEDTIFEMASITKMFTATAVMLLVREGKLGLDDKYTKYFPDYPYPDVTIRHLLTHTSGMPDDFETDTWVCPVWENEKGSRPAARSSDLSGKAERRPLMLPEKCSGIPTSDTACLPIWWKSSPASGLRISSKRGTSSHPV